MHNFDDLDIRVKHVKTMSKTTVVKDAFVSFTTETTLHGVGKLSKSKEKPIQR